MMRRLWLGLILLTLATAEARAVIFSVLPDDVDDGQLISQVSGQAPVKAFAAEIQAFTQTLLKKKQDEIVALLGEPMEKPKTGLAMPVALNRHFAMSGIRFADESKNKDHAEFYPVGDYAGIEVWYGVDGVSPSMVVLYFTVDATFPKLQKVGEEAAAKEQPYPPAHSQLDLDHHIDFAHWDQMATGMDKAQIMVLLGAPPGNYSPETEYLTRGFGWRRGNLGPALVHETLDWRSEHWRIVVEFDEKGDYITCEIFRAGRDPVTNIAERLAWDRERFEKLKADVEKRLETK